MASLLQLALTYVSGRLSVWEASTGRCLIWRWLLIDRVVPLLVFRLLAIAFFIRLSCEAIDSGIWPTPNQRSLTTVLAMVGHRFHGDLDSSLDQKSVLERIFPGFLAPWMAGK